VSNPVIAPSSIGPSFVPTLRRDVVLLPVHDEAILYEQETGALHQLNPIAATVCSCFDDEREIGVIVDGLASRFHGDREAIERDVVTLVRELGGKGLLEGVRPNRTSPEEPVDDAEDSDGC
jgi:hypothetical protein